MRTAAVGIVIALLSSTAVAARAELPFHAWTQRDRGRIEAGGGGGGVLDDPFLARGYATWRVAVHLHDTVAVDLRWLVSPDLGDRDRTPIVNELMVRNEVVPDLSRILGGFTPGVLLTPPLHAEDDLVAAFDLSFFVGGGMLQTRDDPDLVQGGDEQYRLQVHPVFRWGMTVRVKLLDTLALAAHPTFLHYPEQVSRAEGLHEERKKPFLLSVEISVLSPNWTD